MYYIFILCLVPHSTVCEDIAEADVLFSAENQGWSVHTPRTVSDARGIQNAAEHPVFRVGSGAGNVGFHPVPHSSFNEPNTHAHSNSRFFPATRVAPANIVHNHTLQYLLGKSPYRMND